MIVYAKPVLFWVVLLLNCPAVRSFPLIFTSILSSLNGVETLQCYKSRRPYKYNHPCKYGTCWLQSAEGISWYHILGAKLCLSNTNIRIKNAHVCQLVERMTLCRCACLDTRALVFRISTSTWSHTWMSLFVDRWMHFPWFSTYTDRTGTVCNAVVHAAMPHLATSIITSSWCRSTKRATCLCPAGCVPVLLQWKRWEVRTKPQKERPKGNTMEMLWLSCLGCLVQQQPQSLKERAKKEERSNPPVAVNLSISRKTSALVKRAKPSSVFYNPDDCFCGSSWSLHIHFLPKSIFTLSAKQSGKLALLSSHTANPVSAIDNQISLCVTVMLRMINGVRHQGSRQPCTRGDWYVDRLACSVWHHFCLLVPWLMEPGD